MRSLASAIVAGGGPLSPRACKHATWSCEGGFPVITWRLASWRRVARSAGEYPYSDTYS
jgi:hypothetical protein